MLGYLTRTAAWKKFAAHWLGGFTFRVFGHPKFPVEDFFTIVDRMDPNELYAFVSSDYDSLASKMIRLVTGRGSHFTHGGLVLPAGHRTTRIAHMVRAGLVLEHLLNLLRGVDYFALVHIPLAPEAKTEAVQRLAHLIEKQAQIEYDYEQDLDNNNLELYCSELFYRLFDGLVTDPDMKPRTVLGRRAFAPDQILDVGCVIYSNHPEVMEQCNT